MFIEAKAVGVSADASNRKDRIIKKHDHWKGALPDAYTVAVIAGMFKPSHITEMIDTGTIVYWEHTLGEFKTAMANR